MSARESTLLHRYKLTARQTRRLPARSEVHERAHVRMLPADVASLSFANAAVQPIIALFSTDNAKEPVSLYTSEVVYVECPQHEGDARGDAGGDAEHDGTKRPARAGKHWVPLRVVASHAYVKGMRVSGFIHRAVVRLVRD